MSLPKKCLVDTNVPKTANLGTQPDPDADVPEACVLACINAVEHVIKKRVLIVDAGDEIFTEYRQQLSMKGQPGVGDVFMKWVNDHRHNPKYCDRVIITKNGDSYDEFPDHEGLTNFDKSDRKFVAAANAHPEKPPILQATDSKMHISKVPFLGSGRFTYPEIEKLLSQSKLTDQLAEGIYLRIDHGDFLEQRAKLIRPAFIQTMEKHWSRSAIKSNRLKAEAHG